jgi:hypothetical protein
MTDASLPQPGRYRGGDRSMATKKTTTKTKSPSKANPTKALTTRHAPLTADYEKRRAELRKRHEEEKPMFLSWEQDDTAVVEIKEDALVDTVNGTNRLYRAVYMQGNLHGEGAQERGGPVDIGATFAFWDSTVLASAFDRLGVTPGCVVMIDCLGLKKGARQTYKDFVVELVNAAPKPAEVLD